MSYIRLLYRGKLQQSDSRVTNHKIYIPRRRIRYGAATAHTK